MNGQETAPINEYSLAALLGSNDLPYIVVVGKPPKSVKKSLKVKNFSSRVQKKQDKE